MSTNMKRIARSAMAVMALWGCRETPTEPPATPSLHRAAVRTYTAVDLGTLGGTSSFPSAINPRGQVVGVSVTANGETHAFLWQDGVMIDLLGEQYSYSWAHDINPAGQVVGYTNLGAFLWQDGVMTDLWPIGDAQAINPAGAVAGLGARAAFVWKNGVVTEIGDIGGYTCGGVSDINPKGQVVGSYLAVSWGDEFWCHGFLWQNGQFTDLGTLGGENSYATAINPRGQVVGYSQGGPGTEAFLWENGVMKGLGSLYYGGESAADDITPGGEVLGESWSGNGESHAFLWKNGVMTDLGFSGMYRLHMNPKGQIVGTSWGVSCCEHATLWTRKLSQPDGGSPIRRRRDGARRDRGLEAIGDLKW